MITLLAAALLASLPAFDLKGIETADVSAADVRGKPTVLRFWASWCKSCEGLEGEVAAAVKATGTQPEMLAVSLDESVESARDAVRKKSQVQRKERGERYLFDAERRFADALGDVAVPTIVVVGRDGKILARLRGHFGEAQRGELRAALTAASRP